MAAVMFSRTAESLLLVTGYQQTVNPKPQH